MRYEHFRTILETNDPVNHEAEDNSTGYVAGTVDGDVALINEPVTKDEVTEALTSLKTVNH